MPRTAPSRRILFSLGVSAVVLVGCASVTSGIGTASTSASRPAPPVSAGTSTVPPATPSPTGFPSESHSSSAPASACASSADYCDDFSGASSGWPVDNEARFYANYAGYRGGTYRMGERTANAKTQLAPLDTTTISPSYGVQIDVDAVLGKSAPPNAYLGIVCWDHGTSRASEAGFLFFVTAQSVDVTLLSDAGGEPHTIARNAGTGFLAPYPMSNHLSATCVQRHSGGGTSAELALSIDGRVVLRETYAKSVKNYAWTPGAKAGLLVAGKGSDVFYDNFAVTGK